MEEVTNSSIDVNDNQRNVDRTLKERAQLELQQQVSVRKFF